MFLMACITEIHQLSAYPSIDTDVLRTFVAIADQGGFTRASHIALPFSRNLPTMRLPYVQ